jgi:hypothetical protein
MDGRALQTLAASLPNCLPEKCLQLLSLWLTASYRLTQLLGSIKYFNKKIPTQIWVGIFFHN